MSESPTEAWARTQAADAEATAGHKLEVVLRLHQGLCDSLVSLLNEVRDAADDHAGGRDPVTVLRAVAGRLERLVSYRVVPRLVKPGTPRPQEEKMADTPPGVEVRVLADDMKFVRELMKNENWRKPGTGKQVLDIAHYWSFEYVALRAKCEDAEAKLLSVQKATMGGPDPVELNAAWKKACQELEQLRGQLVEAQRRIVDLDLERSITNSPAVQAAFSGETEFKALEEKLANAEARAESAEAAYRQLEAATAGEVDEGMEVKRLHAKVADLEAEVKALTSITDAAIPRLKLYAAVEAEVLRAGDSDEDAQSLGHAVREIVTEAA